MEEELSGFDSARLIAHAAMFGGERFRDEFADFAGRNFARTATREGAGV